MTDGRADNIAFVREYRDAFSSFDPDRYGPMLALDPVYHAGMTMRRGHSAFHQNTGSGRVLYPRALTNKGVVYENLYGMFFDVHDGQIVTMVDVLDHRVAAGAFDLAALG